MAPLPHCDLRYPWLRYQVEGYDEGIVYRYEYRLETILGRAVNRVHVLDFVGLTDGMRQTLANRPSMVYIVDDGHALFTNHAHRRLFEVRGPLVREFMLEFFITYRMSDTKTGLDIADSIWGKSGAWLSEGHFIGCLAAHFELVSDQGLRSLVGDTWAWVAQRPERQHAIMAGAPGATKDPPIADESS
nr:hypothetical protein [Tanacetum cinerariifolium]